MTRQTDNRIFRTIINVNKNLRLLKLTASGKHQAQTNFYDFYLCLRAACFRWFILLWCARAVALTPLLRFIGNQNIRLFVADLIWLLLCWLADCPSRWPLGWIFDMLNGLIFNTAIHTNVHLLVHMYCMTSCVNYIRNGYVVLSMARPGKVSGKSRQIQLRNC